MCAAEYEAAHKWNKQNLHVTTWPGFQDTAGEESKLQNDEYGMIPHMLPHSVSMDFMFTSTSRQTDRQAGRQISRQIDEKVWKKTEAS